MDYFRCLGLEKRAFRGTATNYKEVSKASEVQSVPSGG